MMPHVYRKKTAYRFCKQKYRVSICYNFELSTVEADPVKAVSFIQTQANTELSLKIFTLKLKTLITLMIEGLFETLARLVRVSNVIKRSLYHQNFN